MDKITEVVQAVVKGDWLDACSTIGIKIIDDKTFEQIFVDAGEWIASYEKDGSEESQLRGIVFSEGNMRTLARQMRAVNGFDWMTQFEQAVEEWVGQSAMSDVNKIRCKKNFCKMVSGRIKEQYEQIYMESLLEKIEGQMTEVIGLSQQILNRQELYDEIFRKIKEEQQQSRQESQSSHSHENKRQTFSIPDWKLGSYHIKREIEGRVLDAEEVVTLTDFWKEERKNYPGWYILPGGLCQELSYKTREQILPIQQNLTEEVMLLYAYELVWRYEKCMHLYTEYELVRLKKIWDSYLPKMMEKTASASDAKNWFYIGQVLLRNYREYGQREHWKKLYKTMQTYADYGTNGREDLLLENAKYAYYDMDVPALRRAISKCNFGGELYEQRLQLLGLRVECGELQTVLRELYQLKEEMQQRLEKEIADNSYRVYIMTLQSALLQLLSICQQAVAYENGDYELEQLSIDEILVEIEQKKALFDWSAWKHRTEHELLRYSSQKHILKEPYELNRETYTIMRCGTCSEASYLFYRVMEMLALPLKCGMVTSVSDMELIWIRSLLDIQDNLGIFLLVRGNKSDAIKSFISRDYVTSLEPKEADELIARLQTIMEKNLQEWTQWVWTQGDLAVHIGENVPEILWRISDRASKRRQQQNLRLLKQLMEEEELSNNFPFTVFVAQILRRTSEQVKAQMFSEMMETAIYEHKTMHGHMDGIDLFDFYFNKTNIGPLQQLCTVEQATIEKLLRSDWSSDYEWRTKVTRLRVLHSLGLLNENQYQDYARLVWSNVSEEIHYPKLKNDWMYTLEQLPYIDAATPQKSIKGYFLTNRLEDLLEDKDGCRMHMGHIPYLDELTMVCQELDTDYWTKEETAQLLNSLLEYWQILWKRIETTQSEHCFREYQSRADKIAAAATALIQNSTAAIDEEQKAQLSLMHSQMQQHHIIASELNVCIGVDSEWVDQILENMLSSNRREAVDAFTGAFTYMRCYPKTKEARQLLDAIVQVITYGKMVGLLSAVWTVHNLVYEKNAVLQQESVDAIDKSLVQLFQYVDLENGINMSVKEKLEIRKAAAALAFQLSHWEKFTCGRGVQQWRERCEREEESDEVKNEWIY